MLLVGDIHINSRYKDTIISNIKQFIDSHSEEKNIVFLGDYVYHFSYDRKALLELFGVFLDLYKRGKTVYVLAGNHDRINESFVFEEAKKAFDLINFSSIGDGNGIHFINNITQVSIEGNDVLFFPFNVNLGELNSKPKELSSDNERIFIMIDKINLLYKELSKSNNKNEQISARLNSLLLENILKWKSSKTSDKLILIHHYYMENTKFPGQKAVFNFKDIALAKDFFDLEDVVMMSGHLHEGFIYKNYFCTGSVWSTSPLESNQFKFFYSFQPETLKIKPYQVNINPYIHVFEEVEKVDKNFICEYMEKIYEQNLSVFDTAVFDFEKQPFKSPKLSDVSVTFVTHKFDYDSMKEHVDSEMVTSLKDIKIKKFSMKINQIINMLDTSSKDLQTSISDWKTLLKDYIVKKFGAEHEKYLLKLKELKIM